MLWRPSHTDTAKAAILGLIDVIKFGNPQGVSQSIRGSRYSSGPAVWEKAERMETIESERMDEDTKEPARRWGGGQVVRSREDGMARMGRSARKGVCLLRVPVCWILGLSGGDRLPQV